MATSIQCSGSLTYGQRTKNKEIKVSVDFGANTFQIRGHSVNEQRYEGYGVERVSDRKGTDIAITFHLSADQLINISKAALDAALEQMKREAKGLQDQNRKNRRELTDRNSQINALKKLIGESAE